MRHGEEDSWYGYGGGAVYMPGVIRCSGLLDMDIDLDLKLLKMREQFFLLPIDPTGDVLAGL
jgi:hypothetical protein